MSEPLPVWRTFLSTCGGIFNLAAYGGLMVALSVGAIFFIYGRDLPSHETLANYAPRTITRIYSGDGATIDEFATERRIYAPADEIPDVVVHAIISAEDKNFFEHDGYDIRGIAIAGYEAVIRVVTGQGRVRGASTITQQLIKNVFLDSSGTLERKISEIILAYRIEQAMDKDRILEIYLNEIFFGQNAYGIAAAAQAYFNKSLDELLPEEAAYLAALPKKPSELHPVREYDEAVGRRNYVLLEMFQNGYLTEEEYDRARSEPLRTVQNGDFPAYQAQLPDRDYFSDEIRRQLSESFGESEFLSAGLSVRATIDPDLQADAAVALRRGLERYDRNSGNWRGTGLTIGDDIDLANEDSWRTALGRMSLARDIVVEHEWHPAVVLEVTVEQMRVGIETVETAEGGNWIPRSDIGWLPETFVDLFEPGDIVYVRQVTEGGAFRNWSLRQIPEVQGAFVAMDVNTGRVIAMQGGFSFQHSELNRVTQAYRQPGSTFKPFVYATALDSGYTPATIVVDAPIEERIAGGEIWRPNNASQQFYGPTPLRTGIEQSRNVMTVRLAQEVGIRTVARYAERFGIYEEMNPFLSSALGSDETTLFRMVAAYAMIANGGERVEPTLVDRVQDRYGHTVYRHDARICEDCDQPYIPAGQGPNIVSNRERVMDAVTAYQITSMMEGVVQRGTARGVVNLPVPVAGKTGTTNDAKDVWFIGFTSNIVAGCYMGFDTPRSLGRGAFGGTLCAPVFQEFMTIATGRFGGGDFNVPAECEFIRIDRFTGARLSGGASGPNVVAECFRRGEEPVFGITFDGGFAMAADLPLFEEANPNAGVRQVTTSDGSTATVGPRASFGSLSSGGLY